MRRRAGIDDDQKSTQGRQIHAASAVPSWLPMFAWPTTSNALRLDTRVTDVKNLVCVVPSPRASAKGRTRITSHTGPDRVYYPCRSHPDTHPFRLRQIVGVSHATSCAAVVKTHSPYSRSGSLQPGLAPSYAGGPYGQRQHPRRACWFE